jgi:hypothetical protein
MKKLALVGMLVGVAGALCAQEFSHFAVTAGAGFTTPVGNTGDNLDTGWNVRGGAGVNFSPYFGALLDAGYNSMGITSSVLNNLGYGGGRVSVFSLTLDPIIHLMPKSHVDVYVTGGGGYFRQYQDFTQPAVVQGTGFNPFFGFYPFTGTTNVVVSSYSVNKPGIDAGMGIGLGSKWGGKFFAEARYNRIFMGTFHTDYIPVTFGYRR